MISWRRDSGPADLIAEIEAKARFHAAELGTRAIDARVLDAIQRVPRNWFVPELCVDQAFSDVALPIGYGQTISAPFIVAVMTDVLQLERTDTVLEIGTGSGYQAAVLAELAGEVYSIEIVPELGRAAAGRLRELGYRNVGIRIGDGQEGWPEHSPYHAIVITACTARVPTALMDQLKVGGRLIAPIRARDLQWLTLIERTSESDYRSRPLIPVQFVPLLSKDPQ